MPFFRPSGNTFLPIHKGGRTAKARQPGHCNLELRAFNTGIQVDAALPRHKEVGVHLFTSQGRAAARRCQSRLAPLKNFCV